MKKTAQHKYIKKYIRAPTSDDVSLKISVGLGAIYASANNDGSNHCDGICNGCKIGIKVQPETLTICPLCGSPAVKHGKAKSGWYGREGVWYKCGTVSNMCGMFDEHWGTAEDCIRIHVTSIYIGSRCTQEEDVI